MEKEKARSSTILIIFLIGSLILIAKALQLQVIDEGFRNRASSMVVERYTQYPSRGLIYDRNNNLLVYNNPMYDLLVTVKRMDPGMDTTRFCQLLHISKETFVKNLDKDWKSGQFSKNVPFLFLSKIPSSVYAAFQENLHLFPGFDITIRNVREYPSHSAGHFLGYIREVNEIEINTPGSSYVSGDYVGASGLEKAYEEELRGSKGYRYILKDNLGREEGVFKNGLLDTRALSGKDLISSLDIKLQEYAESLMVNKRGAIVAIEPETGEILALVTSPGYDPSLMAITNPNRGKVFQSLQLNKDLPLFDRSTSAQYPPGSLFKPLLALVALEKETLRPNRTIPCNGAYYYGSMRLTGCHRHTTCKSVSAGIQHSCNAYFVTVFRELVDKYGFYNPSRGLDTLNSYLDKFGLGRKLDIDFPGEKSGNYPSSAFFTNWFKNPRWNSVWIRSLGIGQGELLATNIQLANAAAMIANRGWYFTPHLVKGFKDSDQQIPLKYRTKINAGIKTEHFEPVIDGMEKALLAGTARSGFIPDIPVCGKTGTAENPQGKDHSIFFCFAPRENPKISLSVYIENAGFGGTFATPIASLIIEKYLKGEIRGEERKNLEKRMMEANLLNVKP
jgi:penicillin-binding protein 2